MSESKPARRSPRLLWGGMLAGVLVLIFFLPLFHIVDLKEAQDKKTTGQFDSVTSVEDLWKELTTSTRSTVDAGELFGALRQDRTAAMEKYGKRLGVSSKSSYLVSGSGEIIAIEKRKFRIALEDGGVVEIDTGPVFDNAIRDASGLFDVNDFSNSQDFNALSSEINRRVEEEVFPVLKEKGTVGTTVRFVGGVDIADSDTEVAVLQLVPTLIEFP